MTKTSGNGGGASGKPRVRFHYLKSTQFRVIHLDGAVGGLTPSGYVHMSLYNERPAIPREVVYELNSDGTLSDNPLAAETVSKEGIVREMEVDVLMSPMAAKSLRDWLDSQLKQAKAVNLLSEEKK